MEYSGLRNNNKSKEKVSDVITVSSVTDLPYNSKSGSIAEVTGKGVKELKIDELLSNMFYIPINNTNTGNIAYDENNKFLSILNNLEAVYYDLNNLKRTIPYKKVAILNLIYREYEIYGNVLWKNLNNIKIFVVNKNTSPYIYNGTEWEPIDYVQKSDFVFDTVPTEGSSNLVTSETIYNLLNSKADLINGKVPSNLLPSYVDDVLEFPTFLDFPKIGESGKIYIDISANTSYRWTGSIYKEIQSPIELDEYPILNSNNAIESGGVYSALLEKQDIIPDLSEIRLGAAAGATALLSFTETDPTVPDWAKLASKPSYTASEIGALPSTTFIPSKTSDLTNDSGFITGYTETDPTVPSWAKAATKPTYTASEVGALPDSTVIPDELSDLSDDATHRLVTDAEKSTWNSKQDELISGTNIKTINNTSILGSGDISVSQNGIASITAVESQASGGNNIVTITETNGNTTIFNIKNGTDGDDGINGLDGADGVSLGEVALVQTTGDSEESVMSQKAVTEYGRKVTAEDLAGTSDWIKAKLVEEGWVMNRTLNTSGTLSTVSGYITSMFIPISDIKSHILILCYNYNSGNITNMCFYDSNKTFISGLYWSATVHNTRTITMGTSSSYDNVAYVRVTFNPNKFSECYLLDYTTNEYIIKCDKYLIELEKDLNISYGTFENCILMQQMGDNEIKTMSQKAISDAINYNINIERGTGFTLNSNAYYRYLKLTPKAVSLLNASDKMTFMFSTRSTGNNRDYRYFKFGNGNPASNGPDGTNGVYLGWSYSRNLSANGVDYSLNKPNSNTSPTPDVWLVTWDRINGVVKFYNRTTLVNTLTSDSYKKTQFVNSSGLLTILGGDNNTRIYDIRLFDFDISHLFNNSDVKLEIDYLDGTGILPSQFLSNYTVANSDSSFNTEVNSFQGGGYSATCTYSLDGDNYHIVVKDGVSTSQACGGKPYYLGRANRAQLEKLEFEVVSGVIRTSIDPNNASTVHYYHIYDSNNDEISDYSNIGVGSYTLIRTSSTTSARLDFYKVSGNVEVIMNRNMRYKPISCVFHWSGDTMYNKKFYDDQTKEFITLYTTRVCDTPYTEHTIVKTPQRVILNTTSNMLPHYSGEMAITGGKVYIGMPDYTWKQINNS